MIQKSVLLQCDPARAFSLFTEKISAWWPGSRRHTKDPQSVIRLLPSGRFWERSRDGEEVELGRVTAWEPPSRIALDFYIGTDPQHWTTVVVTFTPDRGGTRVSIDHRPTPVSRQLWDLRAPKFSDSWDAILEALLATFKAEASP